MPSLLGLGPSAKGAPVEFWLSRIHEPDRARILAIRESVRGLSADGRREIEIPELEYRMQHADGSFRWFLARATVERSPGGSIRRIVGTAIDVTERKNAELEAAEQRLELTRLARVTTLGEISATLAHELSQPLTSILANAQAARLMLGRESVDIGEVGRILDDITSEDRRAGEVIRHLRNLLRKGTPQLQDVDVNSVIEEILGLMRGELITRNVAVQTFLEDGLPAVRVDPVELQQVLLNLILNACDAMDGNAADDRVVKVASSLDSSRLIVAVSDAGPGIPAERMGRLFRPFFTTKPHGIGMGLAICQTIVSGCGGLLWAENNPDRGAIFRIALPSARIPATGA
jgi:C4-dicarboxylate-specific signal transduction histidine kinase